MVTVGCDQAVLTGHAGFTTRSNSLLTIVKMAEATDLSLLVELIAENLHAAHGSHLVKERAELILCDRRLSGKLAGFEVVGAQDRRLISQTKLA